MATYHKKGAWNALCDRCGFKFKSDQLKQEWTGLYVCKECFELRHPQDFVRGVKDDPSVAWTRPETTDVEVSNASWLNTIDSVPPSTFAPHVTAVLNSSGVSFDVPFTVLNSSGQVFFVPNNVEGFDI